MRSARLALALVAAAFAPAGPAAAQDPETYAETDDGNLRRAWEVSDDALRREALEWYALEARELGLLQGRLVAHAVGLSDRDPALWPEASERPYFDPAEHAPAQPIPRRRLAPDAEAARALLERCAKVRPPRRIASAWEYDWASGEVRRRAGADPLEAGFRNASLGYGPGADLAEALVLRALDGGRYRADLAGFAHAYTDREGNVYPLSLYEAWTSGLLIEMPDVDALGIAHDVLGERSRWKAPIPASQHDELCRRIEERFAEARAYRGLREALAACYLTAKPVLWDGFTPLAPELHALWDEAGAAPETLAPDLPGAADAHREYLALWSERCQRETLLRQAGLRRQATLESDARRLRGLFVWVLRELGAFEERPAAETPAQAAAGPAELAQAEGDEPEPAALEKALAAVRRMRPSARAELEEALRERVRASPAPQAARIAEITAGFDRDRVPPALEAGPHDGRAYGGPARRKVARGTRRWKELYAEIAPPEGWREPLFVYDFGKREVQRREPAKGDEARLFERALAGEAPDTDLAEALLIARLDRDSPFTREAAFFFRDYAELDSHAFEGITLFDVWSHAIPIDVPDVDVFAYADLVHDRRNLPEVLSPADQSAWYPRMADSLKALRRHVLPARAIAAVWLRARPPLGQGYAEAIDTLHATIALDGEKPDAVAARFQRLGPNLVEGSLAEIESRGASAWNAGNARRDALAVGEGHVRAAALAVLREAGVLEK